VSSAPKIHTLFFICAFVLSIGAWVCGCGVLFASVLEAWVWFECPLIFSKEWWLRLVCNNLINLIMYRYSCAAFSMRTKHSRVSVATRTENSEQSSNQTGVLGKRKHIDEENCAV
jgi:hypothetical protein